MAAIVNADVEDVTQGAITSVSSAVLAWINSMAINPALFDGEDGTTTKLVRCLIAAHFATVNGSGSGLAAGPISSISEGGMSRSFAVNASNASGYLAGTGYGAQAYQLIRMWCGGPYLAE